MKNTLILIFTFLSLTLFSVTTVNSALVDPTTDSDGDGIVNWRDNCPDKKNGVCPESEGRFTAQAIANCDVDEVSFGYNPDTMEYEHIVTEQEFLAGNQADWDHDGVGDACDDNDDVDGIPDYLDLCRTDWDPMNLDTDNDGKGDACDDDDADGVLDFYRYFDENGIEHVIEDNCPNHPNTDQRNYDGDEYGDACDQCRMDFYNTCTDDEDNDGIDDDDDNCPKVHNPYVVDEEGREYQEDIDMDGVGDACDNCVNVPNPWEMDENGDLYQIDEDDNRIGDACEIIRGEDPPVEEDDYYDMRQGGGGCNLNGSGSPIVMMLFLIPIIFRRSNLKNILK